MVCFIKKIFLGVRTNFTQGGVCGFRLDNLEGSISKGEKDVIACREGFYGWMGFGGSIFQVSSIHNILTLIYSQFWLRFVYISSNYLQNNLFSVAPGTEHRIWIYTNQSSLVGIQCYVGTSTNSCHQMCKGVKTIDKLITSILFVSKNTKHMSSYFVGEFNHSP